MEDRRSIVLVHLTSCGVLSQLQDDLLRGGGGKAATAQKRKELLPAPGEVRCAGQTGPTLGGLRSRCGKHVLRSEVLLHGLIDERAADAALVQLAAQALRAVAAAAQAGGEVGVRIGRIVEDALRVEACHYLLHLLVRKPAPAQ